MSRRQLGDEQAGRREGAEGRDDDQGLPTRVAKLQPIAIGLALLVPVTALTMVGLAAERTN
jgi:hypothetical protein